MSSRTRWPWHQLRPEHVAFAAMIELAQPLHVRVHSPSPVEGDLASHRQQCTAASCTVRGEHLFVFSTPIRMMSSSVLVASPPPCATAADASGRRERDRESALPCAAARGVRPERQPGDSPDLCVVIPAHLTAGGSCMSAARSFSCTMPQHLATTRTILSLQTSGSIDCIVASYKQLRLPKTN